MIIDDVSKLHSAFDENRFHIIANKLKLTECPTISLPVEISFYELDIFRFQIVIAFWPCVFQTIPPTVSERNPTQPGFSDSAVKFLCFCAGQQFNSQLVVVDIPSAEKIKGW